MFGLLYPSEQRICPTTASIAVTGKIADEKWNDGVCDLVNKSSLVSITSSHTL